MHQQLRWQIIDTAKGDYLTGTAPGEFATLSEAAATLGFTGALHQFVRQWYGPAPAPSRHSTPIAPSPIEDRGAGLQ